MANEERLKAALADRYQIEREIGSGGMATVYLAQDLKHDRKVAVKVLDPDLARTLGAERFLQEVRVTANLTHPHILPLHDSGESDGFLFYVMPYVKGESLRARLVREKQLPVEDAVQITREIADALAYAHREGVIHRDVKPANIMLEEGHAVLADFGVAHAVAEAKDERITRTGTSLGTPAYMSPEQASGEQDLDGRSDQYALGCVLYEMLVGQPPFTGAQVETVLRQHLTVEPPLVTRLRPSVTDDMAAIINRALAKSPADRYRTTGEMATALASTALPVHTGPRRLPEPFRKRFAPAALAGALVVFAAGLALWLRVGKDGPERSGSTRQYTIIAEVEGSASEDIRGVVGRLMTDAIEQSTMLAALPNSQILRGLEDALQPDTTRITRSVARDLAIRGQIPSIVVPEVDLVGETHRVSVRVVLAENDSVIAQESGPAISNDELMAVIPDLVRNLRVQLGEAGDLIESRRGRSPVVTPSLAAYMKYSDAADLHRALRFQHAITLYKEALELDPGFAAAWLGMGTAYQNLGHTDSALVAWAEADRRQERLGGSARLALNASVAWARGDLRTMLDIWERIFLEFGRGNVNYALALTQNGRHEAAVTVLEEYVSSLPYGPSQVEIWNLATWLLPLGRFEEARRWADSLTGDWQVQKRFGIAVAAADWEEAESQADAILNLHPFPITELRQIASLHAARGRIGEALEALQELGVREAQSHWTARASVVERVLPLAVAAGLSLPWDRTFLRPDTTRVGRLMDGLWPAVMGDTVAARQFSPDLSPIPAVVYGQADGDQTLAVLFRARLAFAAGDWLQVVDLLRPVTGERTWRGGGPTVDQLTHWTLAESYERLQQPDSAIVCWEKLAGFGGLRVPPRRGLTHSFGHRRAALLYGKLGNRDEAIEHWRVFLNDFTDPDPDYQWMVDDARTELARLEG